MTEIGDLKINCGSCGDELLIPISAWLASGEDGVTVETKADVSGLWLHAWTEHPEGIDE